MGTIPLEDGSGEVTAIISLRSGVFGVGLAGKGLGIPTTFPSKIGIMLEQKGMLMISSRCFESMHLSHEI